MAKPGTWLLIGLFVAGINHTISGQHPDSLAGKKGINISYFGNMLTHPGLKVGYAYIHRQKTKEKQRRKRLRISYHQWVSMYSLAGYIHPRNHGALILNAEGGYRCIRPKGFTRAIYLGLAYMRTFNTGPTYRINEAGQVEKVVLAGHHYILPGLAFALGESFILENRKVLSWHIKPGIGFQMPYNAFMNLMLNLEVGLVYKL